MIAKNTVSICLMFLFCLCGQLTADAQLEEKETDKLCRQLKFIKQKSINSWIEQLSSANIPSSRKCALDALAKLGPEATAAVPTLAKLVNNKGIQREVFEVLVKIAEGDDTSSAAFVLIQTLAKSDPNSGAHLYALIGLSEIYNARKLLGTTSLPGWVGVYPSNEYRHYSWDKPVVSKDGKSYSQSAYSGAVGNMTSWHSTETLARDPLFAQKYSDESLSKETNPPKIYYAGKRKVLVWELKEKVRSGYMGACPTNHSRTVVLLDTDKVLISETCVDSAYERRGKLEPAEIKFSEEELAFFDRAEAALENPPRTDFRRTRKLFKPLKKGMTQFDVRVHVGEPDQILMLGEGMAAAVYELLDESTIVLRYSNPTKTAKQFSEGIWQLEYGNIMTKDNKAAGEFIK